ncbi:uncharacterized protein [Montipora foliosa]|uniref:uncharacterized protein n=1 Tax=Montipora foliosa TaxID=591990 RepID=UPI0035F15EB5
MGSHSASPDWQSKVLKKEYQNWLAVGHGLSLTLDGLRPFIDREMRIFHQALMANLAGLPPCTCPTPVKHGRTCAWSFHLSGFHRGGRPKWHQSDSSKWRDPNSGYWEIAKLFMADLGASKASVVDASTTDCTGLINVMFWCNHFRVQIHLIEAVREIRNTKWGHAPRQELTDAEKSDALIAIRNLLQDPELVADADVQTAVEQITLMETVFDAQSVERKVLADFQLAVHEQLGDIKDDIRTSRGTCINTSNKIRKRLSRLEKRQLKFGQLLESVNCRMEEMERRNTPYPTLIWNLAERSIQVLAGVFNSLSTNSVLLWTFVLILVSCFTCLGPNSYNDGCPLEVGDVPFDTKEFNFTSHLNSARDDFTGRLWLYRDLERLLVNSEGGSVAGVVVVGEPGAGKSAISAQLICSRSSNPYIHKRIIGYHLCKYSDKATQDPGRFVRNLADLIARRIPRYGMIIYNSSFIPGILQRSCLRDPLDCFEQAVAIPLHQLKREIEDYFIVIDALDECISDDSGTSIVHFIKDSYKRLPKWIHLVVTTRNDSTVLKHLISFPKLHLSSTESRNLEDIEIFITTKTIEDAPFLMRSDEVSYLTSMLLRQSQGNFLFAKEMLNFLKKDPSAVDLSKLPKTIGEHYESYLRRAFWSREKFKPALAILEVLVASFEPLHLNRLFDVLQIREVIDYEYDFVYTLRALSHFITYGEDNTINLFHLSFIEWLTSKENLGNPYYVSRSRGHSRLAEYYLTEVRKTPNSSENIYRLAQHVTFDQNGSHYLDQFKSINASYVNATIDSENRTLLHLAATKGYTKVLQLLRSAFQNIDCEDHYGFTPAFVAALNGLSENVKFLLGQGAKIEHRTKPPPRSNFVWGDPIQRSKTAFWNSTMMHAAAAHGHSEVVRLLLKRNASFAGVNAVNLTAIELAAENGHTKVVQLLHERGAQLHHLSLQHAAFGGHTDIVKFLQHIGVVDRCMRCDGSFYWLKNQTRYQTAPINSVGYFLSDDRFKIFCQSALHLAVAKNHTKVVNLLLLQDDSTIHCTDFTGRTPLHEAVRQNHVATAELLIKHGSSISRKCTFFQNLSIFDDFQKRSGHYLSKEEELEYEKDLCHCGSTPFLLSARYGHIDIANLLLRHGAKPKVMDCQGATPLHIAACHGHYRFIDWLILHRPSFRIDHKSKNQSTLLHSAVICQNNKDIKPLLGKGAKTDVTDAYGMTLLHYGVLNAIEGKGNVMFQAAISPDIYPSVDILVWTSEGDITVATDSYMFKRNVPLNAQCLKLLQITESTNDVLINKVDVFGRTALHLAAQSGDECYTTELLRKGARTDLIDNEGHTALDVAIDSAQDCFFTTNFDLHEALNMRSHNSVADILLSREAYLTHVCDERQTSLLHRAFEKGKPVIADRILSKGAFLSCRDREGLTPLLIYLQNGGNWLDVVLNRHNVTITIECGKPFNSSEFHLAAFRKPTDQSDNFLEMHFCDECHSFVEDGPLTKAIKAHPRGFRVIDECRDAEGYTALHRAAQGGNLLFLKKFLSWGADPSVLTSQGHSALTFAILTGINPVFSSHKRNNAEKVAALLLRATSKKTRFDIGCNRGNAKLTAYHLAAYAGLSGFVKILLKNERGVHGINVNCSNVHGITPLYLANLNIGQNTTYDDENDPWQEIADLIKEHGGGLMYPNREVELNLLYKHLFGTFSDPFRLEIHAKSEIFYESDTSYCKDGDLDHYNTGTMINPHEDELHRELRQIIKSLGGASTNVQLIPRKFDQLQKSLRIILEAERANSDFLKLYEDLSNGLDRYKRVKTERQSRARVPNTAAVNMLEIPKGINNRSNLKQEYSSLALKLESRKHLLSELRFQHDSVNAIITHRSKYLKGIIRKHSKVFGETKEMFELLEKYEESNLCEEEIFQAGMIISQFMIYTLRSRTNDFISFVRPFLRKNTFTYKRTPSEWLTIVKPQSKIPWNQAIKFLYQQGTQRHDPTFDYLHVLTLGSDKDTRIPLSVDGIFSG